MLICQNLGEKLHCRPQKKLFVACFTYTVANWCIFSSFRMQNWAAKKYFALFELIPKRRLHNNVSQPVGLDQLLMRFWSWLFTKLYVKNEDFSGETSTEATKLVVYKQVQLKNMLQILFGGLQKLSHIKWWTSKLPTMRITIPEGLLGVLCLLWEVLFLASTLSTFEPVALCYGLAVFLFPVLLIRSQRKLIKIEFLMDFW